MKEHFNKLKLSNDSFNNNLKKFFLLIFFAFFSITNIIAQTTSRDTSATFKVNGECVQCKNRIEKSLKINGVKSANWDVQTKMLKVVYNSSTLDLKMIQSKILSVGHDLESQKARDDIYNALPECCHYREMKMDSGNPTAITNADAHTISGIVVAEDSKGNFIPLEGASIFWAGSKEGTLSDKHGAFTIKENDENSKLLVSYAGYQSDSLDV